MTHHFNPRIPYGMRRLIHTVDQTHVVISIHASRMGCDLDEWGKQTEGEFQSTHPVWDATGDDWMMAGNAVLFQSTHPVWDATHAKSARGRFRDISIHASRMGCDPRLPARRAKHRNFNPRIPYGMRRYSAYQQVFDMEFQSTHPVWDATDAIRSREAKLVFQSTHPVWDATALQAFAPVTW